MELYENCNAIPSTQIKSASGTLAPAMELYLSAQSFDIVQVCDANAAQLQH
jgi:hypothetical protein